MPLDLHTGIVHWQKPVITRRSTEDEVRPTHLEEKQDVEKARQIGTMVTRVAGQKQHIVLYVLGNAGGNAASEGNIQDASNTPCPMCMTVLMACRIKGVMDNVTVRQFASFSRCFLDAWLPETSGTAGSGRQLLCLDLLRRELLFNRTRIQ